MKTIRVAAAAAAAAIILAAALVPALGAPQSAVVRRVQEALVRFELEVVEDPAREGTTRDQVTVIFSNTSVFAGVLTPPAPPRPPAQFFGEEIVAEFSFSGQDFPSGPIRFSRRVRDRAFLDARFIRVVNHGSDGFMPNTISLSVDGDSILSRVSMFPRRGMQGRGPIANWNRENWRRVTFWETELARYRKSAS